MQIEIVTMLIAPLVLFVMFVAPIWVLMHYRAKNRLNQGLSAEEAQQLRELARTAERLRERVRSLEQILDDEHAGWREQDRQGRG